MVFGHIRAERSGEKPDLVLCAMDSTQSYALFIPSRYKGEEPWPVIYLFDPEGDGLQAVELFAPLAEEFGYILAGSNISQNGPWENILMAADAMFRDVESKYNIDPYRIYTAGFSGAAEAASSIAVMYDKVMGVIGCGAGFSPNYAPHFDIDFHYIGLIGDRDFHYQEMQKLEQVLTRHKIDHYILVSPGGHDWPPLPVIRESFVWLQFKAMKHDIIAIDDGMVARYYNDHIRSIDSLEAAGNIPEACNQSEKVLAFLSDLKRMGDLEARQQSYRNSPEMTDYRVKQDNISVLEQAFISTYSEAFKAYKMSYADGMTSVQPLSWWKKQVKMANDLVETETDPMKILLGRRLVDFIWRNAYFYYKTVDGTELDPIAIKYLDIWKIAQPGSISAYFFSALYYTRYNKNAKAIENIRRAVANGLADPVILEQDPVLQRLNNEPQYLTIIQHLEAEQGIQ
jgi:hypothetical protein